MAYDPGVHWKRVVGLAPEAADKSLVTGDPPKTPLLLNPKARDEIQVCSRVEQRVPQLLEWAVLAKTHINSVLKTKHGAVLCGPLQFRGQVWPRKPGPSLPPLEAGGGVQTVAAVPVPSTGSDRVDQKREVTVSVDLRYAVAVSTQWWIVLVEQKTSLSIEQAISNAAQDLPKLWEVACKKGTHFPDCENSRPGVVSAVAAGVGYLAISPDEFVFSVEKRGDWVGYPDAISRTIREPFPENIKRAFPSLSILQRVQRAVNYWMPSSARSAANSGPVPEPKQAKQPAAAPAPAATLPKKRRGSAEESPAPAAEEGPAAAAAAPAAEEAPAPAAPAPAAAAAPSTPRLRHHALDSSPSTPRLPAAQATTTTKKPKKKKPWHNADGSFNKKKWQALHNKKPHVVAQKAAASTAGNQEHDRKEQKKEWDRLNR